MKKNINKRVILYAVIAVVLIAGLYLLNNPSAITGSSVASTHFDLSRNNPDYYSLLPPMPPDFITIQLMWSQGIIRDYPEIINESYWKQPEWFPLYNENFLPTLEMIAEENRMPIWSLGVFDSQIYNRINHEWLLNASEIPKTSGYGILELRNSSIVLKHRFWIRAAPGAAKIYGVRLSTVYPPTTLLKGNYAFGIPNETLEQNPATAERYVKVTAVEYETGSTTFNMGTYWPKLSPDYVRQIELTAEIDRNIPKGIHIVGIDMVAPSREYQEEQSLKYLLAYTDPNIGMFRGPSEFRLFIDVI